MSLAQWIERCDALDVLDVSVPRQMNQAVEGYLGLFMPKILAVFGGTLKAMPDVLDDMQQAARISIFESLQKHDPQKGHRWPYVKHHILARVLKKGLAPEVASRLCMTEEALITGKPRPPKVSLDGSLLGEEGEGIDLPYDGPSPEDGAAENEERRKQRGHLAWMASRLSAAEKLDLAHWYAGHTCETVGASMGQTEQAVSSRRRKLLAKLSVMAKQKCPDQYVGMDPWEAMGRPLLLLQTKRLRYNVRKVVASKAGETVSFESLEDAHRSGHNRNRVRDAIKNGKVYHGYLWSNG